MVLVDTANGERWILVNTPRQPAPGKTVFLSCSSHTGGPIGYKDRESLEVAATLSNMKTQE